MDEDTLRLLTSPAGRELLAGLPPYEETEAMRLGTALRAAGHPPQLVAAAVTQSRLRARAVTKFGPQAAQLLFTPDGLEQSSRAPVAARHAHRFAEAGVRHVFDLGCGLGADAAAFARAGMTVTAVDADPATAALARHNLGVLAPGAPVEVTAATAQEVRLPTGPGVGVWFDPARRTPGRTDATGRTRRTFRLDQMSPPWEFVLATAATTPATGAKLSPGLPHARIPAGAQAHWLSADGEVVECALWFGPLASTPGRAATVLRGPQHWTLTQAQAPDPPVAHEPPEPGHHLYDPDRAVVRAGLVGALTAATGGVEVGPGAGYVAAPHAVDVPWARRYLILAALPLAPRPVRAWLAEHGVGRLTIKKRGVPTDPDDFRRRLRLNGRGTELTCALTVCGTRPTFLALQPA